MNEFFLADLNPSFFVISPWEGWDDDVLSPVEFQGKKEEANEKDKSASSEGQNIVATDASGGASISLGQGIMT